jgi:hypothetical protein
MTPDTLSPHDPLQTFSALHISTTPPTNNTNSSSSTSVSTSTLSCSPSPPQHHHTSQRVRFKASPFYITRSPTSQPSYACPICQPPVRPNFNSTLISIPAHLTVVHTLHTFVIRTS